MPQPSRKMRVAAILTLLAFVVLTALAAYTGSGVGPTPKEDHSAGEAGALVQAQLATYRIPLPPDVRFLRGQNRSARDSEIWSLMQLPPEQFAPLRQNVLALAANSAGRMMVEESGNADRAPLGYRYPDWWHPKEHPNATLLHVHVPHSHGVVFVFSESRQEVLVLVYDL